MSSKALWIATTCCALAAAGLGVLLLRNRGDAPRARAPQSAQVNGEEPETYSPNIADPHKRPLDESRKESQPQDAPVDLKPELLDDPAALLAHVRSLETPTGGRERESYLRALCQRLEGSAEALEKFLSWTSQLQDAPLLRISLIVLGRVDSPRAAEFLFGVLERNASTDLRLWAVRSLLQGGRINNPTLLANLDRVEPRESESLAMDRGQRLITLLSSPLPESLAQPMINLLDQYLRDGAAPPDLQSRLTQVFISMVRENASLDVREAALHAIGYSKEERVRNLFIEVLDSPEDVRLRIAALAPLQPDADVVPLLVRLIPTEQDDSLRSHLVAKLPAHASHVDLFERLAREDSSYLVRLSALSKLNDLGERVALERAAESDPSQIVRDAARTLLRKKK